MIYGQNMSSEEYEDMMLQVRRRFHYGKVHEGFKEWSQLFFKKTNLDTDACWIHKMLDRTAKVKPQLSATRRVEFERLLHSSSKVSFSELFCDKKHIYSGKERNSILSLVEDYFYISMFKWALGKVQKDADLKRQRTAILPS